MVPLGGVRALRSLVALSRGKLVMLLGDKGYTRLAEMEGARDPHLAVHGSFSFMTNFHAVRELVRAYGGTAMATPYLEGFKVAAYFFGSPSVGQAVPVVTSLPAGAAAAPHLSRASHHTSASGAAPSAISTTTSGGGARPVEDNTAGEDAAEFGGSVSGVGGGVGGGGGEESMVAALAAATLSPVSSGANGAVSVATPLTHTSAAVAAVVPVPAPAPYAYTRWAFREGIQSFGPEDFSTLQVRR